MALNGGINSPSAPLPPLHPAAAARPEARPPPATQIFLDYRMNHVLMLPGAPAARGRASGSGSGARNSISAHLLSITVTNNDTLGPEMQ